MIRIWMTVLLSIFCFSAAAQSSLSVKDMRFGAHPDKVRLVLELSRISDFRAFILDKPARMVIDLPGFDWDVNRIENISGSRVKSIRHGVLQPGISRIVLDLSAPSEIYNAYILRADGGRPNRLVIDYGPQKAGAGPALSKRYGSLSFAENPAEVLPPDTIYTAPPPKPQPRQDKPIIVIDAGHGGVDPGAVGDGKILEKYITLNIARKLAEALNASGRYKAVLTRDDDRFIKLHERVRIAQRHRGDMFISIHADSVNKPHINGVSIYTLSDKASDEQTARLAARENKADLVAGVDLNTEDAEVANILLDLVRRDTMNQSKFLANTLVDNFEAARFDLLENPHRFAGFAVLKAPDIPSVLIETGFVSNSKEAKRLMQRDYQEKLANTIAGGIDRYFERLLQNSL